MSRQTFKRLTDQERQKRRKRQKNVRKARRGLTLLGIIALLVLGFASAGALARGSSILDTITGTTDTSATDTTASSTSSSTDQATSTDVSTDTSSTDTSSTDTSSTDTSTTDTTATDTTSTATDTTSTDTTSTATDTTSTDTTSTDTTTTGTTTTKKKLAPLVPASALPSSVQLYQWATDGTGWITGNLGSHNSSYTEGNTIPFRLDVSSITAGAYTGAICRDFTSGTPSDYGYLKLLPFNTTINTGDAVTSTVGAISGSTGITAISAHDTGAQGSCNAGQVEYDFGFTTDGAANRFIYWGGYLAKPGDAIPPPVGTGTVPFQHSAGFFPGSSLHMVLVSPAKDRSINPGSITILSAITVNKLFDGGATPTSFCFDISPNPSSNTPNPQCTGPSNIPGSVTFLDLPSGTYSVTEEAQAGYFFNGTDANDVNCTFTASTGSAVVVSSTDPQFATCDFHNKSKIDSSTVTHIKNSGGTTITDAAIGSTVHDSVSVTGSGPTPTGSVTFELFATQDCSGSHTDQTGVSLTSGAANSSDTTVPSTGLSYIAVYGGDANYNGSTGACEPLTPDKLSSNTVTHIKNSGGTTITDAAIGSTVHDSVSVTGSGPTPTGTVTFELFATQDCSGSHTDQTGVSLTSGAANSSDTTVPSTGLSYIAVYGGDGTYNGSTGACEPLTPDKLSSNTVTHIKNSGGTTITDAAIGSTVHDSVTVTGSGPTPTGSVTFELFATQDCSGSHTDQTGVSLTSGSANSSDTTVPSTGLSYIAVYGGDGTYNGSTGACEPLTPDKIASNTVTHIKNSGGTTITDAAIGSTVHDSVTVSGTQGTPTGTVTFELFATQDCSGAHTDQTGVALVSGSANSSDTTVPSTGLSYIAVYGGDSTYNGSTGACEPLTPDKIASNTVTHIKNSDGTTITDAAIGSTVHDSVTVSGTQGTPTGTVTFELFATQDCSGAHTDQTGVALVSGSANSSDTTVPSTGLSYIAVYGGDSTYNGSTGACEPLTPDKIASNTVTHIKNSGGTTITDAAIGSTVHDSVTVSGTQGTPTGTVTFELFATQDCSGAHTDQTGVALVSGSANSSDTTVPSTGLSYIAVYGGDSTYNGSTGACEPLTPDKIASNTVTHIKNSDGTTITDAPIGSTVHDSVTVTGSQGTPTGTVTFELFATQDCSGAHTDQTGVALVSGSANSASTTVPSTGLSYIAVYGGDSTYNGSTGACEPLTPDKLASNTVTHIKNSDGTTITDAPIGSTVHDSVTVSGAQGTPTGTVTFELFATQDCSGDHTDQTGVALVSGSANSSDTTVPSTGLSYIAVYSGDDTYLGSTGACEPLTPDKLASNTVTHIKNSDGTTITDALTGSTVHDSVTVSGSGPTPTGTVTFELFATQDCSGDHSDETGVALVSGSANSSDTTVPSTGLSYIAVYSGDDTYLGSTGDCEPLTPDKHQPAIDTTPSAGGVVGIVLNDSADLSGGFVPTGTITFELWGPDNPTCNPDSGDPVFTEQVSVDGNGTYETSDGFTTDATGTYSWTVSYGGDDNNLTASSGCGVETAVVTPAQPTIKTTPSKGGDVGVTLNDSATLADGFNDPQGTITFELFAPNNPTCARGEGVGPIFTNVVEVDGNGDYATSAGFKTTSAGTWRWVAIYSGDQNNLGAVSGCNDEEVTVTNPPPPPPPPPSHTPSVDIQITKTGSPSPSTTGTNITWTMVVTNNGPDTATGVNLADPLPAGTSFVSVATTQGTCAGGALLTCQLGTINVGSSVTITLVTTANTVGTDVNTATVVANEPETNTNNNTASASVVVTAPFKPPVIKPKKQPVYCAAVAVNPKSLFAGRHAVLTMKITKHSKPVAGIKVLINGGGLGIITSRSNSKGIVTRGVLPKKAGIVVFKPVASKSCKTVRIGVIGVFTPPVTG